MGQKGIHTWDMHLEYHRCPECGHVFESRQGYDYILGKYQKEEECPRCYDRFMITKKRSVSFGPLIGDPQPVETEWGK